MLWIIQNLSMKACHKKKYYSIINKKIRICSEFKIWIINKEVELHLIEWSKWITSNGKYACIVYQNM